MLNCWLVIVLSVMEDVGLLEVLPWLIAMAVLIGCSAFFSASEAALFSLRPADRHALSNGTRSQRMAASLLEDPERVLSAVLFWNLVVNIAYFAIASIVERQLPDGSSLRWPLRIGSLLVIIFFSEMLPKTVAVLITRSLSSVVSLPLSFMIRVIDPIMPTLRLLMLASRRLVWPGFKPEEGLVTADLERAIKLSTTDAKLLDQERTILENIVALSELRADEAMRPNTQLKVFRPPVRLEDLQGTKTRSGYLFLTEPDSENIGEAVRLESLWSLHPDHLEAAAEPVDYVPWCATLADVAGLLLGKDREVAAVVNERGETIGAITTDDLMDVLFSKSPSRSMRILNREPIQQVSDGVWHATSMTNLRRLGDYFELELPSSQNNTVGGVIQESLQRIPEVGDACTWGPFRFEILETVEGEQLVVQVKRHTEDVEE